jgi:hypothetical protein
LEETSSNLKVNLKYRRINLHPSKNKQINSTFLAGRDPKVSLNNAIVACQFVKLEEKK